VTVRIFINVRRGPTDATAVCVFPWEKQILEHIHGQETQQVSIDDLCNVGKVVKVEKVKFKYEGKPGPDLRAQLEAMAFVEPDEDPANDPAAEFSRLIEKYGMDSEVKMTVAELIYGRFETGMFERLVKEFGAERIPKPAHLKAQGEGLEKPPSKMNVGELRAALNERGIDWDASEGKQALREKLEGVLVD
jgi:hypothetical protein